MIIYDAQYKKRALMQYADNAGPGQPERMIRDFVPAFADSINIVVYVDEQRMSRPDCTDAHAHLGHCCSQKA